MADEEFDAFVEECRKVGLADMKAGEAAWSQFRDVMPADGGPGVEGKLMNLLQLGAEYARMQDRSGEEATDGR